MVDYGRTSGTGGPQTAAITNDDAETMDLPENDNLEEISINNFMPKGAY